MNVSDNARRLMMLNRSRTKNRQMSLLSRSAAHVGLKVGQVDYWGHIQGKIQPTFRNDYSPSTAAMS